jgi:hypothetical protein
MLAVLTEKLLGLPFSCGWERRFISRAPALRCSAPSLSSLLVVLLESARCRSSRFMERERPLLRAVLDLARLRESVDWKVRERHPEERCRLSDVFRAAAPDSATTVPMEEPATSLPLLLPATVWKLSSEAEADVAVDEQGDSRA